MRKKLSTANTIILVYLAVQFLPIPLLLLFPPEKQIGMSLTIALVSSLIGSIIMIILNRKKEWTPPNSITQKKSASYGKIFLWGVLGFIGAIVLQSLAVMIETAILGVPPGSQNTELLLDLTSAYPLYIFGLILFAPIMEELVFRKAIVTQLVDHIGISGAAVISSLLFAFAHMDGHMLIYASLGLWFSYLYYKTNNILTPMLAHGIMNAFASLPVFFPEWFLQ